MLSPRQEINKVLAAIREKTGVVIPSSMIFVEKTKRMIDKERDGNPLHGEYYNDRQKIFLSPKVFSDVCTDREYHRQLVWGNMTKLAGKFEIINTEEKLTEYVNEYTCREIMNVYFVIAHECGHYVHYKYFGGRGLKIPRKHGFGVNGRNSRKNAMENFADGFAEYVFDLFTKEDGIRAKRMRSIVEQIRKIDIMDAEDNVLPM